MQETAKRFDCVRMKRDAQEQISRETGGVTPAGRVRYFREAAERYGATMKERDGKGDFKVLFERLEVERKRRGNL